MRKRVFDHLHDEICASVGRWVSRYELWLLLWETAGDPDALRPEQVRFFVEKGFDALLREEGLRIEGRARRRLERRLLAFRPGSAAESRWRRRLGWPRAYSGA